MSASLRWFVRAACAVALVAPVVNSVGAVVIPASADSSRPSVETNHDMQTMPGGAGWEIGSANNGVGVSLDPTAGPWIKTLLGINGGPVNADDTGYTNPNSYQLVENLVIGGNLPWTDFHEIVLTPGWNIGALITANGAPVPGLNVDLTYTNGSTTLGSVTMTFDPLLPGTQLLLRKQLIWVGDPNVIGNLFSGIVKVAQYPTPEPATVVLLAAALGLVATARRSMR